MEVKKSPQADLENKKNIFLEIGLMLALGTILFAFEWKVSGRQPADFVTVSEIPTEIEMVPITMMHQITPPPPPAPKPFDLLEIVDETDPLPDDMDLRFSRSPMLRTIWISSMQMTKVIIKNLST